MGFLGICSDIGIDLGTKNTLIYMKGKGIVLREATVVAINKKTGKIIAVGNKAEEMIERTPKDVEVIRPLKDGVIANYQITEKLLKILINRLCGKFTFAGPRIVICYPSGITQVEERSIDEAARNAGAREVFLIEEPIAAAIGSELPIYEPVASFIVDIGGGTTDVAVISLGGIVNSKSIRVAGESMDRNIIAYVKKKYNILIGTRTAEYLKKELGIVNDEEMEENRKSIMVKGRDLITGLPKQVEIFQEEIYDALIELVENIVNTIKQVLEKTPPELSADIMKNGIILSGGGALMKGIDEIIEEKTAIPVKIAHDPLDCVALGAGKYLKNLNLVSRRRG